MTDTVVVDSFVKYMSSVADARYVMRTISRLVDDCAKSEGLDPLEHQAIIQIAGSRTSAMAISTLANRLDIVPGLASRIVKQLRSRGLVESKKTEEDKRISLISVTEEGLELLKAVDEDVRFSMTAFHKELTEVESESALQIFKFYLGENIEIRDE